jgi:hypothetical protein
VGDPFVRELTGFEPSGGDLAYNNFHSRCFEIGFNSSVRGLSETGMLFSVFVVAS